MTRSGGCLCGAVRYEVRGPMRDLLVCHCVECRRWTGGAWHATAAHWADLCLSGDESLRWVTSPGSEHGAERGFCARCGTGLFWRVPGWDRVSIAAGSLDEHPSVLRVVAHIWTEHAVDWAPARDDLPAYRRGYPTDGPPLEWR